MSDANGQDAASKAVEKPKPTAEERRKAYLEREAAEVARAAERRTIGDYLEDEDPLYSFVRELGRIVYRDSPNDTRIERITPPAQVVFNVFHFEASVNNGGFGGYFDNGSGDDAHATLAALREIGAPLSAAILAKALTAFPNGRAPSDQSDRYDLLSADRERYDAVFEELSTHFFRRVTDRTDENLHALLLDYMKRRRDEPYAAAKAEVHTGAANAKTPPPLPGEAGQLSREKLIGTAPETAAIELTKAFAGDDLQAAFEKYERTRGLTIVGTVKATRKDPKTKFVVEIAGHEDQVVHCSGFDDAGVEARIAVGKPVKIKGVWSRDWRDQSLHLKYAVLVE